MSDGHLLKTALHGWHAQHGGKLVDFAGWSMPVHYSSIMNEHRATRSAVTLFDVSHMGRFRFTGSAAVNLLNGLVTRRVTSLSPGDVRYAMVTNEQGGVLDDVLVSRYPDAETYGLVVNASNRDKLQQWIEPRTGKYDVQFQDETTQTAMIAVQGPRAIEALQKFIEGGDVSALRYYEVANAKWDGTEITISRTGYTGEDGVELVVPRDIGERVWQQLMETISQMGGCAAGLGARDTLRLEAGMPLYGHELSEELTPFDVGLGFAVQLKDRQFPGSEALAAAKSNPAQSRIGLTLEGKRVPREHYGIFDGAEQIGQVTSGTFSPTFQRPIAMGLVTPGVTDIGDELQIDVRGKRLPAQVVSLPFYRKS